MERAPLHALDGDAYVVHTREHDHLRVQIVIADERQHLESVDARHLYIEQHGIEKLFLELVDGLDAVRSHLDRIPLVRQDGFQRVAECGLIVDDKQAWC